MQAHVASLHQVEQVIGPAIAELLGDHHHQAQVGGDHAISSTPAAALQAGRWVWVSDPGLHHGGQGDLFP